MEARNRFNLIAKESKIRLWELIVKIDPRNLGLFSKYGYYLFISSLLIFIVTMIFLLNGYFKFINPGEYSGNTYFLPRNFQLLGYFGVFIFVAFSPFPDYFIVPILGYLAFLGLFNFYLIVLVSAVADLLLMELDYMGGRFAGRPIVIKALRIFRVDEDGLEEAEKWIKKHGPMAVFIATFIPFVKHITSVASGTLKMNWLWFTLSNFVGFFIRFLLLAYLGFRGVYLFSPNFDFSIRYILIPIAFGTFVFIIYYLWNKSKNIMKKIWEGIKREYSP